MQETLESLLSTEGESVSAAPSLGKVHIQGVRASYDEARPYLGANSTLFGNAETKNCLLWLGSSLGNFTRSEAAEFLTAFVQDGMKPEDTFLIGIDSTADADLVELAYGDPQNVTRDFILNGVDNASAILEEATGRKHDLAGSKFHYVHRFNEVEGCHEVRQSLHPGTTLHSSLPDAGLHSC